MGISTTTYSILHWSLSLLSEGEWLNSCTRLYKLDTHSNGMSKYRLHRSIFGWRKYRGHSRYFHSLGQIVSYYWWDSFISCRESFIIARLELIWPQTVSFADKTYLEAIRDLYVQYDMSDAKVELQTFTDLMDIHRHYTDRTQEDNGMATKILSEEINDLRSLIGIRGSIRL